jgi:hypothetical protein
MPESNGDKAFLHQMDLVIDKLKRNGSEREIDLVLLQAQRDTYERVVAIEKRQKKQASYPSILYLLRHRPMVIIPFASAGFVLLSMVYITESRDTIFAALGVPADLFANAGGGGLATIVVLLLIGLINLAKRP